MAKLGTMNDLASLHRSVDTLSRKQLLSYCQKLYLPEKGKEDELKAKLKAFCERDEEVRKLFDTLQRARGGAQVRSNAPVGFSWLKNRWFKALLYIGLRYCAVAFLRRWDSEVLTFAYKLGHDDTQGFAAWDEKFKPFRLWFLFLWPFASLLIQFGAAFVRAWCNDN